MIFVSITILAGALVAGLHAGMIYNTFPLMGGQVLPPDYTNLSPIWLNATENPGAVQFHHRVLAISTVLVILSLLFRITRSDLAPRQRLPVHVLAGLALIQGVLGITTLIFVVPIDLAASHQAGAVALFAASVWAVHAFHAPPVNR